MKAKTFYYPEPLRGDCGHVAYVYEDVGDERLCPACANPGGNIEPLPESMFPKKRNWRFYDVVTVACYTDRWVVSIDRIGTSPAATKFARWVTSFWRDKYRRLGEPKPIVHVFPVAQ